MRSGESGTSCFMITIKLSIPKKITLFFSRFHVDIWFWLYFFENMNLLFVLERVCMYQGKQSL